jgi:RNA polymerase sigma-70 factor (ECF subfamily)
LKKSTPPENLIADWRFTPDRLAGKHEILELLDATLLKLDEKQRVVFLLRDVEGFSVRETAEVLGITEANVTVRLLRARLQLRERLARELGDPQSVLRAHQH